MTVEEVIHGFKEGFQETPEWQAAANELYQEAARLTMEMNTAYHPFDGLREIMSRITGKDIDGGFRLVAPFYTDFGKNITFGKDVFVNSCCHFQDQGGITIGDGAFIGHNVVFATVDHDLRPAFYRKCHYAPIVIGDHVWIGSNATILKGVTVGEWAVVAAGAVVTRDVEPYSIVGGIPAKRIRYLTEEERRTGMPDGNWAQ